MKEGRRRAVFLDRDGVLNAPVLIDGKPHPPAGTSGLELLPGVSAACQRLKERGFLLIVITNQPDVARGNTTHTSVASINQHLCELLPLDAVYMCVHDDSDNCACRKPKPGLIIDAARGWDVDLETSIMVGDRWRDIEAGRSAGCTTVYIDRGYSERTPVGFDACVQDLEDAATWILDHRPLVDVREPVP
jgi:D-glycero-D-manno-heptose 1,7-bisphosphate phosphatase